jgi:hypothetical protein
MNQMVMFWRDTTPFSHETRVQSYHEAELEGAAEKE